jgi:hypothetical protein
MARAKKRGPSRVPLSISVRSFASDFPGRVSSSQRRPLEASVSGGLSRKGSSTRRCSPSALVASVSARETVGCRCSRLMI